MTTTPHGQGRPDHHRLAWRVWDAGELASTHPTRADAQTARAALLAEHLHDFPRDHADLEAALMIEPTPTGPIATTTDQPGQGQFAVWALWDAADLVSLHATEHGAHAARATHLAENAKTDPDNQSLLERSVRISAVTVHHP